jgi:LPS-assembly protein
VVKVWNKKKCFLIGLVSLITIGLFFPSNLFSQTTNLSLDADIISVDEQGLLTASGNVVIRHGSKTIKANSIVYDKNEDHIEIEKIDEFIDANKIKISASSGELNSSLNQGTLSLVKVILDEQIKIHAGSIEYKDGELSSVAEIKRITSCNECEGKAPQWHFTASSASRDLENLNVIYRNVTVRVKDFPIAYIPYLRLPDPTVDRAQGFLIPIVALTSNLGVGIKLPYFVPIGESRDILATPLISSNSKTLEYRYRHAFSNGSLLLDGALSSDILSDKNIRSFYRAQGNFQLSYGIKLSYDIGQTSDASYLSDYGFNENKDFNSQIALEKIVVDNQRLFNGQVKFKDDEDDILTSQRYASILGGYNQVLKQNIVPGNLRLSANLNSSINFDNENSFSRPPSSAQLGLNYYQPYTLGPINYSTSSFFELNSFVNSENNGTTDEEFSTRYGAAVNLGIPVYKKSAKRTQTLTPKAQVSFSDQTDLINGDAFIGLDELSFGNLFSTKKITSLSESELGATLSFGFDYYSEWQSGQKFQLSFGGLRVDRLTYAPPANNGFSVRNINYIAGFKYKNSDSTNFSGSAFFSHDRDLMNATLKSFFSWAQFDTKAVYEFISNNSDQRLTSDIENLNFLSEYKFNDNSSLNVNFRHDVKQNKTADFAYGLGTEFGLWTYNFEQKFYSGKDEKMILSAVYDDECTRFTVSFQNQYRDTAGADPIRTLALRFQFKPFAKVQLSRESVSNSSNSQF